MQRRRSWCVMMPAWAGEEHHGEGPQGGRPAGWAGPHATLVDCQSTAALSPFRLLPKTLQLRHQLRDRPKRRRSQQRRSGRGAQGRRRLYRCGHYQDHPGPAAKIGLQQREVRLALLRSNRPSPYGGQISRPAHHAPGLGTAPGGAFGRCEVREPLHQGPEARQRFAPVTREIEGQETVRNSARFQAPRFANLPDLRQSRIHRGQAFLRYRHNSFRAPSRLAAAEDASLIVSVRLASALSTESQWIFHSASSTLPSVEVGTQARVLPLMLSRESAQSLAPVKRPFWYCTFGRSSLTYVRTSVVVRFSTAF